MKDRWMKKFVDLCDSGKPWYVFLAIFSALMSLSALVELFTEQRIKWWVWGMNVVGILNCLANIVHCRLLQEKADNE